MIMICSNGPPSDWCSFKLLPLYQRTYLQLYFKQDNHIALSLLALKFTYRLHGQCGKNTPWCIECKIHFLKYVLKKMAKNQNKRSWFSCCHIPCYVSIIICSQRSSLWIQSMEPDWCGSRFHERLFDLSKGFLEQN